MATFIADPTTSIDFEDLEFDDSVYGGAGASVDVGINFLGGVLVIATLNTTSAVTVGADVDLGTL